MDKKKILIVDDDANIAELISLYLTKECFQCEITGDGETALEKHESFHPDLILLDYEMPEENGPTVLNKIRENSDWAEIPVLFLTGVTERDKIQNALSLKPQGYLLKPIDHEKLKETISNVFNN